MRSHGSQPEQPDCSRGAEPNDDAIVPTQGLPDRLMTVREVAAFIGCHEESVRRAYLCGQLKSQRFGVRRLRFLRFEILDWIARGARTTIS